MIFHNLKLVDSNFKYVKWSYANLNQNLCGCYINVADITYRLPTVKLR